MSLTSPGQTSSDPAVAFVALCNLVRKWRAEGRKTTTAGLKPALQKAIPGFSEADFGFLQFRDFVAAAVEAGHIQVQKLPTGHPMVLLPDESLIEEAPREASAGGTVPAPAASRDPALTSSDSTQQNTWGRLKQDVWATFVNWHYSHDRLWDRTVRRAFAFPVNEDRGPAWFSEPERFVRVDAVDQDAQIGWMREWAETLPPPSRDSLIAAIAPGRPLGQFRRELNASGLAAAWRAELQRRVLQHAAAWARTHSIPLHDLLDQRSPLRPPPASPPTQPPSVDAAPAPPALQAPSPLAGPSPSPPDAGPSDDTAQLRALLHRAIDRMSLAELISLPIRAEHLLNR